MRHLAEGLDDPWGVTVAPNGRTNVAESIVVGAVTWGEARTARIGAPAGRLFAASDIRTAG